MQKDEKVWTNQFECGKGSVVFSHGKSDARGVLVAFREAVDYKINSQHVDNQWKVYCSKFANRWQSCNTCQLLCAKL